MTVTVTYANTNVKAEFVTNTFTPNDQLAPDVLGLSGGGFVSAYNNSNIANGFILLNFYDSGFNNIGGYKIPYSDPTTIGVGQPSLTELTNGNVLVVWDDVDSTTPSLSGLRASIFDQQGNSVAIDLGLSAGGTNYTQPSVTALAGGGFVAAFNWTGGSPGIYMAVYDSAGVGQTGFIGVDLTAGQSDGQVTALSGGGFVVSWTDHSGANALIQGQTYNAAGVAQTGIFNIGSFGDNSQSSIAAMQNGDFAVAYTDSGWAEAGTLGNGITLQIFTPGGSNVTPGTFIHVNTTGVPDEVDPDVTVLANGFILVTWTHPFSPTDNDIYARLFDQAGNAITVNGDTDEFVITASGTNDTASAVAALFGGDYVVSWQDSNTDGSGGQISSTINEFTRTVIGDGDADTYLGDALRDSMDGGGGDDTLAGGGGNDTILGGSNDDSLSGGDGNDLVQGGFDGDIMSGGNGNDRMYANTLADRDGSGVGDTIFGDFGNDSIFGSGGADNIDGGDDADKLFGRDGDDTITGGSGDDKVKGGKGADLLQGGFDGDTLIGAGGDDTMFAATQAGIDDSGVGDTLVGGGGNDSMTGSAGNDFLTGGIGADVMDGRDGADTVSGGSGKDVITGGGGADQLSGGGDKDVFTYVSVNDSTALSADLITDLSNKDKIDLRPIDADNTQGGDQSFHLAAAFTNHAGELVVTFHSSGPLAGLTTVEGDINGDGVADLTITISGDHHTFTGFLF